MLKIITITLILSSVFAAGSYEQKDVAEYLQAQANDLQYSLARSEVDKVLPERYAFLSLDYVAV